MLVLPLLLFVAHSVGVSSSLLAPPFVEPSFCSALGMPGRLDVCGLCVLPGEEGRACTCPPDRVRAG